MILLNEYLWILRLTTSIPKQMVVEPFPYYCVLPHFLLPVIVLIITILIWTVSMYKTWNIIFSHASLRECYVRGRIEI